MVAKMALRIGLALASVAAGASIAVVAVDSVNADQRPRNRTEEPAPHYAKNASGLSYGSNRDATSPDNLPDLIKALATNGKEGYVKRSDYEDPIPQNPAEAVKWTEEHKGKARTIPVYEVDGTTKIGEYVIKY